MLKPKKDPEVKKPNKDANKAGVYRKKKSVKETKSGVNLSLVIPGGRKTIENKEGIPIPARKKDLGDYIDLGFAASALEKPQEDVTKAELAAWKATKPGWDSNPARDNAIAALEKAVKTAISNNSIALGVGKKGPLYDDWLQTGGIDLDSTQYNKELKSNQTAFSRFQYQEGDENSPFFANMDPEQISQIQKSLVGMKATGFKGKYIDGIWDTKTAKAFKEVLIEANYQNTTWDVIMETPKPQILILNKIYFNDILAGLYMTNNYY